MLQSEAPPSSPHPSERVRHALVANGVGGRGEGELCFRLGRGEVGLDIRLDGRDGGVLEHRERIVDLDNRQLHELLLDRDEPILKLPDQGLHGF